MNPRNIALTYCIKTHRGGVHKVGWIEPIVGPCPDGWLPCIGQRLRVGAYQSLYAAVGDQFCPPTVTLPLTRWQRLMRRVGFKVSATGVPNPDYRRGWFVLPDLRASFLGGAA